METILFWALIAIFVFVFIFSWIKLDSEEGYGILMLLAVVAVAGIVIVNGIDCSNAHDQQMMNQGFHKTGGDEAIYTCPDCHWNGTPSQMVVIYTNTYSDNVFADYIVYQNDMYPHYYCPSCGAEIHVYYQGSVWVDSNNHYKEDA